MEILLFFAGVAVTVLVFALQKRSAEKSEKYISAQINDGNEETRLKVLQLESSILDVVKKLGLSESQRNEIISVFDDSGFEELLSAIDGDGTLKSLGNKACNEVNKRLLFYLMKNIHYMPFPKYKYFMYWLMSKGYVFPDECMFLNEDAYIKAQRAMEHMKRKRGGLMEHQIDADSFFRNSPYR